MHTMISHILHKEGRRLLYFVTSRDMVTYSNCDVVECIKNSVCFGTKYAFAMNSFDALKEVILMYKVLENQYKRFSTDRLVILKLA